MSLVGGIISLCWYGMLTIMAVLVASILFGSEWIMAYIIFIYGIAGTVAVAKWLDISAARKAERNLAEAAVTPEKPLNPDEISVPARYAFIAPALAPSLRLVRTACRVTPSVRGEEWQDVEDALDAIQEGISDLNRSLKNAVDRFGDAVASADSEDEHIKEAGEELYQAIKQYIRGLNSLRRKGFPFHQEEGNRLVSAIAVKLLETLRDGLDEIISATDDPKGAAISRGSYVINLTISLKAQREMEEFEEWVLEEILNG